LPLVAFSALPLIARTTLSVLEYARNAEAENQCWKLLASGSPNCATKSTSVPTFCTCRHGPHVKGPTNPPDDNETFWTPAVKSRSVTLMPGET
jgi:hypothetical protein